MPKISDLWIVQTSNNLDSFDHGDEVYLSEMDARREANRLAEMRAGGRTDYVTNTLDDAIREMVRQAGYTY